MVKIIIMFFVLVSNAYGQIVLTEVLSNEPSGRVRLEWIELYNRSTEDIDLSDYVIIVDSDINTFDNNTIVPSHQYAVLARQLLPEDGSDSYEGFWGDSSGVWGDSEKENYPVFDISMTLANSSGFVRITDSDGSELDYISWSQSSDDGRSIERDDLLDDFSSWHDCFDIAGSTPGRANSLIPEGGAEELTISVHPKTIKSNSSQDISIEVIVPAGSKITIDVFDETGKKRRRLANNSNLAVLEINWDGTDSNGTRLNPGPYFIGFFLTGQKNDSELVPIVIAP